MNKKLYAIRYIGPGETSGNLLRRCTTYELFIYNNPKEAQQYIETFVHSDEYDVMVLHVTDKGACPHCGKSLEDEPKQLEVRT